MFCCVDKLINEERRIQRRGKKIGGI